MTRYIERKLREVKIAEGLYKARIGRIAEEKAVETPFGIKDKLIVPFEVENGSQPIEINKRYNYSIHENSSFAGLIRSVTGSLPGEKFDLDTLEGQRCQVVITHRTTDAGDVWENIQTVMAAAAEEQ